MIWPSPQLRLSYDHRAWLWATGLEHQPGPTETPQQPLPSPHDSIPCLLRRLRGKPKDPTIAANSTSPTPVPAGPACDLDTQDATTPKPGHTIIEIKNVTNAATHAAGLGQRRAHLTPIQEHSLPAQQAAAFTKQLMSDYKKKAILGPIDPNLRHFTGGVGAIASEKDSLFMLDPIAPSFKEAVLMGRVGLFGFGRGKSEGLALFLHYLWVHRRP